ncbi:MAG: hypothetical protein A2176_00510, partial [Spirochaetes bacterium RBG_13_51_14]
GNYNILEQIVSDGIRVKVPTSCNPRPGYDLNIINRILLGKQNYLERCLQKIGVMPNYSCVCYDSVNVPAFGDRLGWAESSAVQFANSVLGARTNRNTINIDMCSALTGVTPEFGYLLDENRRGQLMVKLEIDRMDASALGYILGQKVVDKVPVVEHYPFTRVELKNMGGAMAASGGVALFHIEGLTPEAPDLKTAFDGKPESTITITQKDLDDLRTRRPERATSVVFGCPQMTYEEAMDLSGQFKGKKVRLPTWFCMIPEAKARFEKTEQGIGVMEAGVAIYDHCPLTALSVRIGNKHVLTSSGKCFYYLKGADYGTTDDCLEACGVER